MPKIIKSGIDYTPDVNVPQPDEITIIYNTRGELEAVRQPQAPSNWFAQEGSEGFIENKPPVNWNGDEQVLGTIIGDTLSNEALGLYSTAEGSSSKAVGNYSHAEGYQTEATGNYSHAEGNGTKAVAAYSHSSGIGTVTPNVAGSTVRGKYNSNLNNTNFVDIVGWGTGTSNTQRKNISALTADGRLILANTITLSADRNSQGGYTLPIPDEFAPGQQYVMSYVVDEGTGEATFSWSPIEMSQNSYGYSGATVSNPGPFTIYDGTADPSTLASFGKPGDIYFRHS